MKDTTVNRIIKEDALREKEMLSLAADESIRRVLALVKKRDDEPLPDNPHLLHLEALDLALINIKYGTFIEEGFFKMLRNTSFAYALGASMVVGFASWAILNIVTLFS